MTNESEGRLEVRDLTADGSVIEIVINGKLRREDNERLLPQLEAAIDAHGMIRLLLRLEGFAGMDIRAAIDDLKFDVKHLGEFERIAVVGDRFWEECLTRIGAFLVAVEIRYFNIADRAEAESWVLAGGAPGADPLLDVPAIPR